MPGRSVTVGLLVLVGLLLFIPVVGVVFAYLFTDDGVSWHTVYWIAGGLVLLTAFIISWRRFQLP